MYENVIYHLKCHVRFNHLILLRVLTNIYRENSKTLSLYQNFITWARTWASVILRLSCIGVLLLLFFTRLGHLKSITMAQAKHALSRPLDIFSLMSDAT